MSSAGGVAARGIVSAHSLSFMHVEEGIGLSKLWRYFLLNTFFPLIFCACVYMLLFTGVIITLFCRIVLSFPSVVAILRIHNQYYRLVFTSLK